MFKAYTNLLVGAASLIAGIVAASVLLIVLGMVMIFGSRSPIFTFTAPSGGSVELECGSATNFASAIYLATLGRDRYIYLRLIKADRD